MAILVVAIAAVYFLLTFNRTLNPSDEGYLLYNFQKAAQGQVPHRDFYDAYGPGVYWVGAALFNLFGTRIIVIRVFVVILKTLMALIVFLIARRILPPFFAFIGSFLFILNWGDPLIGATNVLYAGHVNQFFALIGMLCMLLYIHTERRTWLLGVSACVGLSILFKLHVPTVDLIGFSLLLCLKEQAMGWNTPEARPLRAHPRHGTALLLRGMKLLGIFGAALFYFSRLAGANLGLYSFFLFLLPICLMFMHILLFEFRTLRHMQMNATPVHWDRLKSLYTELVILLSGPIISILVIALLYSLTGGLADLIHDTFALPMYIKYHHSMPDRRLIAAFAAGVVCAALLMIELGKRLETKGETVRRLFAGIVSLLLILPPAAGLYVDLSYRIWHRLATHVFLPAFLTIGVYLFIQRRSKRRPIDDAREFSNLGLILIFASQSLLLMSLRSDETHIVIYSTAIFVAIAFVLHELYRALRSYLPERAAVMPAAAVAACLAAMSIPCLWSVKLLYVPPIPRGTEKSTAEQKRLSYPMLIPDFPRSRGLKLPIWNSHTPPLNHPIYLDMNDVVTFLRRNTSPEDRIFLMCGDQIIYFLSERESALQKENYFVYLSNMDFIDRTNTGRVSDDEILAALGSAMPRFIVKTPRLAETAHFSLTWPKTDEFIRNRYETDTTLGEYEILRPRGKSPYSR